MTLLSRVYYASLLAVSTFAGIGLMALGIRSGREHGPGGTALFGTFYDIAVGLGWTLLCLSLARRLAATFRGNIRPFGSSGPQSKTDDNPQPSLSGLMTTSSETPHSGPEATDQHRRAGSSGMRVLH